MNHERHTMTSLRFWPFTFFTLRRLTIGGYLLPFVFFSCGSPNTPLDADTRQRIDSAATEQIRIARSRLDSQCTFTRYHGMHKLVDSIKQVRMREIEEQLKTVPR